MLWNNHIRTTLQTCWQTNFGRHGIPNDMLADIFYGNFGRPMDRPMLTEAPWSMNELKAAIRRAKTKRTGHDLGLVAELLKHAPEGYLEALLDVLFHALSTGQIPTSWQATVFKMLPKSSCAKFASDFRPIASLRLLCKIFAYPMLGWMDKPWKIHSQKGNTVFENKKGLKNTCQLQICV